MTTDEVLYLPEKTGVASGVISTDMATAATPTPPPVAPPVTDTTDNGDAMVTALADDLEYTLTVAQALERIASAQRQTPSARSIQRYCIEGRLAAQKIRTVYGSEWLINESSLARLIDAEPVVTSNVSDAISTDMATAATPNLPPVAAHVIDTHDNGDAGVAAHVPMSTPVGERRTIAEVLIENAKLVAQVEGKDDIIAELKEDRDFLREEVREGRRTRDDVKNIAERMLDTLKTMATGRLSGPTSPQQEPIHTSIIDPEGSRN